VAAARARWRSDIDQAKQAEADVMEAAEYLEHASHLALSSLLLVSFPAPQLPPVAKKRGVAAPLLSRLLCPPYAGLQLAPGSSFSRNATTHIPLLLPNVC